MKTANILKYKYCTYYNFVDENYFDVNMNEISFCFIEKKKYF